MSAVNSRRADARSRRDCAFRALKPFGMRSFAIASTGAVISTVEIRRTCRSAVSTIGRGSSRGFELPGSRTTTGPERRPPGMMNTSPIRRVRSEVKAASRLRPAASRVRSFSRLFASSRICAYSSKSPRWHCIASRYPSNASSCLRSDVANPTTERSA